MKTMTISVTEGALPTTVGSYLRRIGLSVTFIKKVKMGGISLKGERVTVRATVTAGDLLTLTLPEERSESIRSLNIPLTVLYEDEHILAVDKPRGMPTHPSRGNSLPTLAEAVMGMYGGNFVFRAVSRLDRDTSGIVVIAKDQVTAGALAEQMKSGLFGKRYICLTEGVPAPTSGIIDAPIKRESEDSVRRIVAEDGKSAVTEYEVLDISDGCALCSIRPRTGRTHQIRVHMAHIGCPLHGDFLYGRTTDEGYFLRCIEVEFTHPKTREQLKITASNSANL